MKRSRWRRASLAAIAGGLCLLIVPASATTLLIIPPHATMSGASVSAQLSTAIARDADRFPNFESTIFDSSSAPVQAALKSHLIKPEDLEDPNAFDRAERIGIALGSEYVLFGELGRDPSGRGPLPGQQFALLTLVRLSDRFLVNVIPESLASSPGISTDPVDRYADALALGVFDQMDSSPARPDGPRRFVAPVEKAVSPSQPVVPGPDRLPAATSPLHSPAPSANSPLVAPATPPANSPRVAPATPSANSPPVAASTPNVRVTATPAPAHSQPGGASQASVPPADIPKAIDGTKDVAASNLKAPMGARQTALWEDADRLIREHREDDAIVEMRVALSMGVPDGAYLERLAGLLLSRSRGAEAVALLQDAVTSSPFSGEARLALGMALEARKDTSGALEAYRSVASLAQGQPDLLYRAGEADLRLGDTDAGAAMIRQAAESGNAEATSWVAGRLAAQGDLRSAEAFFRSVLDRRPTSTGLREHFALFLVGDERAPEATSMLVSLFDSGAHLDGFGSLAAAMAVDADLAGILDALDAATGAPPSGLSLRLTKVARLAEGIADATQPGRDDIRRKVAIADAQQALALLQTAPEGHARRIGVLTAQARQLLGLSSSPAQGRSTSSVASAESSRPSTAEGLASQQP